MGLDMYLYKKTYVQNWSFHTPEQKHKVSVKLGNKVRKDIKPERVCYITEQVAYWRKFNALHGWFVNECGGGVDECQEIYVEEEKLKQLLKTLNKVKKVLSKSKKTSKVVSDGWSGKDYEIETFDCHDEISALFPPTSGFFFGSTDIDDYFKSDIDETIKVITEILKENEDSKTLGLYSGDFYYRASW